MDQVHSCGPWTGSMSQSAREPVWQAVEGEGKGQNKCGTFPSPLDACSP